ncbi:putative membrane protein [Bacillus cereus]|nr:putative membrane protein [Bacillus cereus]
MGTKETCSYLFLFLLFYFLSLFPFSGNEFVYVIAKIGAAAGVINIVMMSVVLYFQSKKMRHLLN